jgi:hypothetical protein
LPGSASEGGGDPVDAERWAGHQREHAIRHEAYAAEMACAREYFEAVLAERDRRLAVEREMLATGVNQRAAEMERRLIGLNELRNEVLADRAQFVTRAAFEPVAARQESFLGRDYYLEQAKSLADKLDVNVAAIAELRREISNQRSRAAGYAAAVGIAVVVMTAVILLVQFTRTH